MKDKNEPMKSGFLKEMPFSLYDNIKWKGKLNKVVGIDEDGFVIRGLTSMKTTYFTFKQYLKRRSEFEKSVSSPVTVYYIKQPLDLKNEHSKIKGNRKK